MSGIIDGRKWTEQRLAFLQAKVQDPDIGEDQRTLMQVEIDQLEGEAATNRRRFRRWLVFGGPTQP